MNQATPHAAHVFLQLAIIIGACRLCGYAMKRVGQPHVIGEMVAGVLRGPSWVGAISPEVFAKMFPTTDKPVLFARADRAKAVTPISVESSPEKRMTRKGVAGACGFLR